MTDLLGGSHLSRDIRCVCVRAEQLAGIAPDDTVCPLFYLQVGDSDEARAANSARVRKFPVVKNPKKIETLPP